MQEGDKVFNVLCLMNGEERRVGKSIGEIYLEQILKAQRGSTDMAVFFL